MFNTLQNKVNINNISINQMIYKEVNVNKTLYKILTTTNFYFKSMRFFFENLKHKKDGLANWLIRLTC